MKGFRLSMPRALGARRPGAFWLSRRPSRDYRVERSESTEVMISLTVELENPEALNRRCPYYDPISTLGEASQKWWSTQT